MEKGLWDYFRKKILKHSFLKTGHLLQDILFALEDFARI